MNLYFRNFRELHTAQISKAILFQSIRNMDTRHRGFQAIQEGVENYLLLSSRLLDQDHEH
jgi:hypothetical protein